MKSVDDECGTQDYICMGTESDVRRSLLTRVAICHQRKVAEVIQLPGLKSDIPIPM
jgi:hypothetical protein